MDNINDSTVNYNTDNKENNTMDTTTDTTVTESDYNDFMRSFYEAFYAPESVKVMIDKLKEFFGEDYDEDYDYPLGTAKSNIIKISAVLWDKMKKEGKKRDAMRYSILVDLAVKDLLTKAEIGGFANAVTNRVDEDTWYQMSMEGGKYYGFTHNCQ